MGLRLLMCWKLRRLIFFQPRWRSSGLTEVAGGGGGCIGPQRDVGRNADYSKCRANASMGGAVLPTGQQLRMGAPQWRV